MRISDGTSDVCSSDLAQGERGWSVLAVDAHGLQLGDQFIDVGDLDAGLANRRLADLEHLDARGDVDAIVGGRLGIERLGLRLHDVGQRRITRLVEAKIGGDDRGEVQLHRSEEYTAELKSLRRNAY